MSDAALRRTVRRCTAILLIPIASVPIVFVTWIEERGVAHYAGVGTLLADVSWLLVAGATLYLIASGLLERGTGADADDARTGPAE